MLVGVGVGEGVGEGTEGMGVADGSAVAKGLG
jgi:hypothetical protein